MAAGRLKDRRSLDPARTQTGLLISGFIVVVAVVVVSPLLMVRLSDSRLPWSQLADVGQAYGGASALLSAAALCGVGASLLFQRRQVRQELADIDRQQHMELLRLAIDNPELIEVLDARTANSPHARQDLYANLTMMYWLAVWQLGEVDDDELRGMAAAMFQSEVTRNWWSRVGAIWIGTKSRTDRRRFVAIISSELMQAESTAPEDTTAAPRTELPTGPGDQPPQPPGQRVVLLALTLASAGVSLAVFRTLRRRGHGRTIKAVHDQL